VAVYGQERSRAVNGSGATGALVLDDHLSSSNGTYTIRTDSVTRSGYGRLIHFFRKVDKLSNRPL
jgi:hypothetical protein